MMPESTPKREWTGTWIPREIWDAKDLTWMQKCLWAEIRNLQGTRGCYASNGYLAEKMGSTQASIANMISVLRGLRLIVDVSFDGRRRFIRALVNEDITCGSSQHSPPDEPLVNPPVNQDKRVEKSIGEYIAPVGATCESRELPLSTDSAPPKPKREAKPRERNELLDALALVETANVAQMTPRAWAKVAVALKEIRSVAPDLTVAEIKRRAQNYRDIYTVPITALALADNWAKCAKGKTQFNEVRIGL